MSYRNIVGKLDKRISLVKEYQVDDGNNGVCSTFREYGKAWAHMFTGTGTENFKFQRVFASGARVFVIRNRTDIDISENDIIEYGGDRFNIRHITKISDREMYIALEADKGNGV